MGRSKKAKAKATVKAEGRRRLPHRARWAWVLGIGLLGAAGLAAKLLFTPDQSDPIPRGEGFNILLISMDTTRADHLGCYGHPGIKTPNIDRLAAEGTIFTQCTATAPLTLPSHASIMTGTDPYVHGVRENGSYHLHGDNETLAEALRAAGYATAAEVAAFVLNREFGLDQGFDVYHDTYGAPVRAGEQARKAYSERSAGEVCAGAMDWLRKNGQKRFFLFVHFFDPHEPYAPPSRFASQYRNPHLGEIAYVDEQIGRLMAELQSLGVDDKTLVILTADHGEGLGQHNESTHSVFVYDTTMAVPLIFRCPGRIPKGQAVHAQVRTIDIAPTVLAFLEMEPMADAQGRSLLPLMAEPSGNPGLWAYGESMFPMLNFDFAPLRVFRAGGWKYIHAPRAELYHVSEDPGELRNLAAAEPQRVATMRKQLYALIENAPVVVGASSRRHMSASDIEKLQGLGYMGAAAPLAGGSQVSELDLLEPRGLDPKDYVDEIDLSIRASSLRSAGDLEGAERALGELFARAPRRSQRSWWAQRNLAKVLEGKGQKEDAIEAYENALHIRPRDSETLTDLGLVLAKLGRIDEAILRFREALGIEPVLARTHRSYARALRVKGESDEAIRHFRLALEMDPQVAKAWYSLGFLLEERGDHAEVVKCWRAGLALSPSDSHMVNNLAWLLATCPDDQVRDGAEAVRLGEMALRATEGGNPAALNTLAAAYAEQGRLDDAVASARRAIELADQAGAHVLAERIRGRLRMYEQQQPIRDE